MSKPRFTELQIARMVKTARDNRRDHDERLRVRRMLVEMASDAFVEGNKTGTNIVEPFNKSKLIIKTMIGDVAWGLQQYEEIIASNAPRFTVPAVAIDSDEVTKTVDKNAAKQEAMLTAMWDAAGGRRKQHQIARSQSWGRVGWYFSLPREASWGMPTRTYYGDMSDDELQALKDAGKTTPEPIEAPTGQYSYAEAADEWLRRRQRAAKNAAVSARSMFTLDAYPPDVVYESRDSDGVKWAFAQLEVPAEDCGPGSEYAESHRRRHNPDVEGEYGLYYDKGMNRIIGGVTTGGESGAQNGQTWTYTIFATRDEVYCLVSHAQDATGTLVWYSEHDMGICPFVPAPGFYTDSRKPGGEYSSPMEAVFALAGPLNQALTLASNVAVTNSTPRWVLVRDDGSLVPDPETGDPKIMTQDTAIGLNPNITETVAGTPVQLKIDADFLFQLIEFYYSRLDLALPSRAATGQEGTSGTAWGLRQMIEQQLSALKQPVDNHAEAVKMVVTGWIHALRAAHSRGEIEDVYAFALPKRRSSARDIRGLVSLNPADLVDAIVVRQSADTAQAKVVKQQAGIEIMQAGMATRRRVLEDYFESEDARGEDIEITAYDLEQFAFYGDTSKIQPGSVLYDYALALRGQVSQKMLALSPAYAIASAEQMAMTAQQQFQQTQQATQAQGGNVAAANGISQPGMNGPMEQPGMPGGGQVPPVMAGAM